MKYEVNGYKVEMLTMVENDATVFLVDGHTLGTLVVAKPTIKEALEFVKKRIQNGKGLTITGWTYDAVDGEFVGKLKKNKRKATEIRIDLRKVTQRKVTKKEAEDALIGN